jgi:hypothetical protein
MAWTEVLLRFRVICPFHWARNRLHFIGPVKEREVSVLNCGFSRQAAEIGTLAVTAPFTTAPVTDVSQNWCSKAWYLTKSLVRRVFLKDPKLLGWLKVSVFMKPDGSQTPSPEVTQLVESVFIKTRWFTNALTRSYWAGWKSLVFIKPDGSHTPSIESYLEPFNSSSRLHIRFLYD